MINTSHLHPLLVHLPIGILIITFLAELFFAKRQTDEFKRFISFTLLVGAVSAVLSTLTGWFLGQEGAYSADAISLHKWLAVAFTVLSVLLYFMKMSSSNALRKLYMPLFGVALVLLTLTGHYGAAMTHGENFLFQRKEKVEVEIVDVNEAFVYADIIRPIIENHCTSCHNPGKSNGKLMMNTPEGLVKGGLSGSVFKKMASGQLLLLERIHLPLEQDEHMPPSGKEQLTEDQIALIQWWIDNDHCFECKVSELERESYLQTVLTALETDKSTRAQLNKEVEVLRENDLIEVERKGVSCQRIAEGSNLVEVNLSRLQNIDARTFDILSSLAENIVGLDVGYSNFNDALSNQLEMFPHLTHLELQGTDISEKTVSNVGELNYLESLNLYGTNLGDECLVHLKGLENLKKVYTWQTSITPEGQQENGLSQVEFIGQSVLPLYAESQLEPPLITYRSVLFDDTSHVQLSTTFEGASIYYTTDGTVPTSGSDLYNGDPLVLSESVEVTALTLKENWKDSEPISVSFHHLDFRLLDAQLSVDPHENYAGAGALSMIDQLVGDTDFRNENWVGFQGSSPVISVALEAPSLVSSVSVGALMAQSSWIFLPKRVTVYGSSDNQNFTKLSAVEVAADSESAMTERTFINLRFEPSTVQFLRVEVTSLLQNPSWHPSPGEPCYVFLDEVLVGK